MFYGLVFILFDNTNTEMQNFISKIIQNSIVFQKPNILSEKSKALTSL